MNWGYFWVKYGTAAGPVKTVNIVQITTLLARSWKGLALEKGKTMLVFGVCTKKQASMVLKLKNLIEIVSSINYLDCKWYFNF